jgi:hypothetical protein
MRFSGKQFAGLWHCKILRLSIEDDFISQPSSVPWSSQPDAQMTALRMVIGEEGVQGFSSELQVPWSLGCGFHPHMIASVLSRHHPCDTILLFLGGWTVVPSLAGLGDTKVG